MSGDLSLEGEQAGGRDRAGQVTFSVVIRLCPSLRMKMSFRMPMIIASSPVRVKG